MDYRIISIGVLSVHELWNRQGAARTPHATTTLIRSGDRTILVDPGLPGQVIAARLSERAGIEPEDVSDVFLTNFRPAHRMGLLAFPKARWIVSEAEREAMGAALVEQFRQASDDESREMLQQEIALLKRCVAAPDKVAEHVDLFPLPGFTPGTCGLLLSQTRSTTLIAGDAVATIEHLEQGRVLRGAYDTQQAQESLVEAIEIADVIIPGHDNITHNPTRRF
ncbi:MBL fold metallo-hydrolase [Phycisphaerales bacterium AB-hyl4]|uniref:MBL fold metallo-hydrolase n=1 Tax=Natronomicrosphaera hydrolytica TaxID=3242702 RepID=A0ABV4U480_9BACT